MSHWLIIIWLMNWILAAYLVSQPMGLTLKGPLNLTMRLPASWTRPNASAPQPAPAAWVLHSDFGLPLEKPPKNRFERLAAAIARAQNP